MQLDCGFLFIYFWTVAKLENLLPCKDNHDFTLSVLDKKDFPIFILVPEMLSYAPTMLLCE